MGDPGAMQAELLGAFFEESFEGIEKLEAGLLRLERGGVEMLLAPKAYPPRTVSTGE